ncbi:MAG TPA: hypothetical protein VEA58_09380 [Anaerovoracaceae bacterium]|nr:hypothetical protein [Anaerovoracaceae bacterium]
MAVYRTDNFSDIEIKKTNNEKMLEESTRKMTDYDYWLPQQKRQLFLAVVAVFIERHQTKLDAYQAEASIRPPIKKRAGHSSNKARV